MSHKFDIAALSVLAYVGDVRPNWKGFSMWLYRPREVCRIQDVEQPNFFRCEMLEEGDLIILSLTGGLYQRAIFIGADGIELVKVQ